MDDKQLEELMVQSFIKIMMETEKSAEGKAELAQAQARAEQRRKSEVSMQFGNDGLHINTDNGNPNGQRPQQQQFQPSVQQHQQQAPVPQYGSQYGQYDGGGVGGDGGGTLYPTIPYPNVFTRDHPAFEDSPYPLDMPRYTQDDPGNSSLIHGATSDPSNYSHNPAAAAAAAADAANRQRRRGRDHTNYVLPPNLDPFQTQNVYPQTNESLTHDGPPGLPVSGDVGSDRERGLTLVVVDKTDDEDENSPRGTDPGNGSSAYFEPGYSNSRSNSDVYPIDKKAIERDMYKQVYEPTVEVGKKGRSASIQTLNGLPPVTTNAFGVNKDNKDPSIDPSMTQNPYNNNPQNGPLPKNQPFVLNVTDYDSESTATDTGRTSAGTQQLPRQFQHPQQQMQLVPSNQQYPAVQNDAISYEQIPMQYRQPIPQIFQNSQNNNLTNGDTPQQMYSMSQIDYDRYMSNQSQLTTVREDLSGSETDRSTATNKPYDVYRGVNNRTFLIHPSAVNSTHSIREAHLQDTRVLGPGYKFQVNVAKRASILNRAEQLLDARRGQYTDRSDSSDDELERIDEDDDEDNEDYIDDMKGPRHRALRHVRRRQPVYDDTTSYNSSDDVLNTMRYHPRGPVSQAARRARLHSVNARLNKQKRIRAARRQNLPPPPVIDDDLESSESDAMEPPSHYRRQHNDMSRYEESTLRDLSNNGQNRGHGQPPLGDGGTGAKGRRVMFFRNGDIHYKPKQVLISNKTYTNLEKLLVDLSSMVETSTGVKHIFSWPEGREIKSITEFENGKYYVCSSTSKLQRVDYGNSKENHWKVGKIERHENFLFQKDGKVQSPLRRPRVLTIISNMYRDSREKLILNTNSQMNFEDILNDIVNMVNIPNPPVRALYTERKPHQKVESYSQLIRDFGDHDNFIACGEEMVPIEFTTKRPGESADLSVADTKRGVRKNPRSGAVHGGSEQSVSPVRSSADGSNVHDRVNTRQQAKVRRRKTDSVRVDINGKTREFFPPTLLDEEDDGLKPDKKLRLDWVYGFRGRDVKQNLAVLPGSGELVYFVASVVVVYDKKFATQKHYLGHSEEITCLTVHPNGRFVATGQTAGKTPDTGAHVRIWDGLSLSTYAVVGLGTFQQGIACVNFSEKDSHVIGGTDATSGELLMAIDDSDRHVLTVWEWQTEKLIARTTTTNDPVVSGCFYPFDESILVTYGKEHIHFWRMFWEKGRKIMRDKLSGCFEDEVPKFVTSICFSPTGDVITGDSSGAILVWTRDNNSVFAVNNTMSQQTKKAHKKSVSALCMLGDGTLLSGGGNEVKAWDSISSYSLVKERVLPETAGHVRSIVPVNMGGLDGSIYVATTRNKVLEGSLQLKFKFLIQGHVEELWAVESHPLEQTFVSAGHDQSVVKWSAVSHAPVWRVNVENPCTSISIDPKGRLIALGTTAGKVVILNSYNGIQLTTLGSGNAQVNALSFSPDGKQLAVGTFDGRIQIFYVEDEGHNFFRSQTSALKHNNMFIMHMDWSIDSRLLQAVLGDYDIVYWDVTSMQKVKSARSLRDVSWATHNCPIGHSIIGPWQNVDRGDVINVVSRSQYRDLMVVGDTKGRLRLYKWPCSIPKSGYRQSKVYSSNVTCATFTCDDGYVITSGGNDAALMQFAVLDPANTR